MRPSEAQGSFAVLRIVLITLGLSLTGLLGSSDFSARAEDGGPRFDSARLKKYQFKQVKPGDNSLRDREKLAANAKANLAPEVFAKFMDDVSALEVRVKEGRPRNQKADGKPAEVLDAGLQMDVPSEVEFKAEKPVQTPDEFFSSRVPN